MTTTATGNSGTNSGSGGNKRHGTLNSEISNWSAASSAASFDYQPAHANKAKLASVAEGGGGDKRKHGTGSESAAKPRGERVPPEGAPAIDKTSPQPPKSGGFVQRIQVKPEAPR